MSQVESLEDPPRLSSLSKLIRARPPKLAGLIMSIIPIIQSMTEDKSAGESEQDAPVSRTGALLAEAGKEWQGALVKGIAPRQALTTIGPKYLWAIRLADIDYDDASETGRRQFDRLLPEINAANARLQMAIQSLLTIFEQLPATDIDKTSALAAKYLRGSDSAEIAAALADTNGLIASLDALTKACLLARPVQSRVAKLEEKLIRVHGDCVLARLSFGHALRQAGNHKKANHMETEARLLMGGEQVEE